MTSVCCATSFSSELPLGILSGDDDFCPAWARISLAITEVVSLQHLVRFGWREWLAILAFQWHEWGAAVQK